MADTLIYQEISITRLQKGWTHHGGVNKGYQITQDRKEWNCQACGLEQPAEITAYLFPFENADVLRICPLCQNIVTTNQIASFLDLVELVRS